MVIIPESKLQTFHPQIRAQVSNIHIDCEDYHYNLGTGNPILKSVNKLFNSSSNWSEIMTQQTRKTRSMRSIQNCRVAEIGVDKYAECLKQGPATCSYALPFGYCFLCSHPRLNEIIENTHKQQALALASNH
jgi:ribosomal protein S16